jgi:hypothetical protein
MKLSEIPSLSFQRFQVLAVVFSKARLLLFGVVIKSSHSIRIETGVRSWLVGRKEAKPFTLEMKEGYQSFKV